VGRQSSERRRPLIHFTAGIAAFIEA